MISTDKFARVEIKTPADLRAWLLQHHHTEDSVWLVTHKKRAGAPYVSTSEVLDELIAFGWIDGLRRKLDDARTMQLISPRKQQAWAATYQQRAARLEKEGVMHDAGRAAIARAKAAGLWDQTAAVDALMVPTDLQQALVDGDGDAFFSSAAPSYRRNVLRWLHLAKQPATRAKRISAIVAASAANKKLPQL
jgi:uncharacterized protein YdeI (YjbR/CyaY-like superfamily)